MITKCLSKLVPFPEVQPAPESLTFSRVNSPCDKPDNAIPLPNILQWLFISSTLESKQTGLCKPLHPHFQYPTATPNNSNHGDSWHGCWAGQKPSALLSALRKHNEVGQ